MIIVLAPDATRQDDEILRQISEAGFKPLYLPVLADGAHGTGPRKLVPPMSRAAIGVGADRLMIEVHPDPKSALSDGRPSLSPPDFDAPMRAIRPFVAAAGKIPWRKSPVRARAARAGSQTKRRPRS